MAREEPGSIAKKIQRGGFIERHVRKNTQKVRYGWLGERWKRRRGEPESIVRRIQRGGFIERHVRKNMQMVRFGWLGERWK